MGEIVFSPAHKPLDLADDPSRPELAALADAVANLLGDRLSGGGNSGMVLLASGTITAVTPYIDFDLSDETYVAYSLRFVGASFNLADHFLLACFSTDGGLSFDNDRSNHDTYAMGVSLSYYSGLIGAAG